MKKNLAITQNQSGYTLVEIIVALIVGTIVLGSLSLITVNQSHLSQLSRDLVLANAYSEGKYEALRSIGFNGLNNGTTSITSELPVELNSPRTGTMVVSSHTTSIKKVVLTIVYNDQGATRTYSYTSLIGELGVGQY